MRVENRFDLLRNAVNSIPEFYSLLTIVDNSPDGLTGEWPCAIFRPPVPFTFVMSHNWWFRDARSKGCKFVIWQHTDATSVDGGHLRLLEFTRKCIENGRKWGTIFTNYDTMAAVNLDAIDDVGPYDTILDKYFCDDCLYYRMRLRGWENIQSGIHTDHVGSQTIKSDPKLNFLNSQTFDLYKAYFIKKWGGMPGHEVYTVPFNNPIMELSDSSPAHYRTLSQA
jgi:hypothetical protein